ncbi:MAG: GNAT family N-acetyltransferase [Gemmatimonadaceae bacterium]
MSAIRILPTADEHVEGFNRCVGVVARERRWLVLVEAPPLEASRAFHRHVLDTGGVHVVAVDGAGEVVGWCDVSRDLRPGYGHGGRLGMGLLPAHRGQGLGRRLIEAALEGARQKGMERVELEVYASNERALRLYEHVGFEREGVRRRARFLDGVYEDDVLMARLFA